MGQSARRLALLSIAAGAAIGFGACPGAASRPAETRTAVPLRMVTATRQQPLLGVLQLAGNRPAVLARFDPLSLRPVSRRVAVAEYHNAWSLSPDASQLALGRGGQGIGIEIVDLEAMKLVRQVRTGIAAEALGWLAPRRLVAALQRGGTVLVDPLTARILRRWPDFSFPDASAPIRHGIVMLLPQLRKAGAGLPLMRIPGAARLAIVDAQGRLRSATLERIRLGVRSRNGMYYADRAGLAVDVARARAYVFAADAPAAEINLRTMRVSYHRLEPLVRRPGELEGRSGQLKNGVLARERGALSLGDGHVVVFGRDFVSVPGRNQAALMPAGATLVNTANWSWRTLDRRTTGAAFVAGRLVVYGPGWYPAAGVGLRAYTLRGRRVFYLFKGKRVFDVHVAADLAYVRTQSAVDVVDVLSGKLVAEIVPPRDLADVVVGRS